MSFLAGIVAGSGGHVEPAQGQVPPGAQANPQSWLGIFQGSLPFHSQSAAEDFRSGLEPQLGSLFATDSKTGSENPMATSEEAIGAGGQAAGSGGVQSTVDCG